MLALRSLDAWYGAARVLHQATLQVHAGEVVAVNDAVASTPEALNQDAYAAWLFRLKPAAADALAGMLDAAAYTKLVGEA